MAQFGWRRAYSDRLVLDARRALAGSAVLLAVLGAPSGRADAAIIVTLGAPGAEFANFTGPNGVCSTLPNSTCVYGSEIFSGWAGGPFTSGLATGEHSFPAGTAITGTYSGAISRDTNSSYGGAYGTEPYPSARGTSQYTLSLSTIGIPGINYFGVWITAMDASNKLTLFSNGTAIFNFISSDLRAAINALANPGGYFGHPDNGRDSQEPFAYVNIFDTDGFFDAVSFTNNGGSNFESSNHAAGYFNPPNVNGTTVTITTNTVQSVAEPAALALLTWGAGLCAAVQRRRRARGAGRAG